MATAVGSEFGPDEIGSLIGCALIAYGCWDVWRPASFIVPGVIVLWVHLPTRVPLVLREAQKKERRTD